MNKGILGAIVSLGMVHPAQAADDFLDLYYLPYSSLEFVINDNSLSESGDGFGAKIRAGLGEHKGLLLNAEYQNAGKYAFGVGSTEAENARAGVGAQFGGKTIHGGFYLEYVRYTLDNTVSGEFDIKGPGLQGLVIFHPSRSWDLTAQLGLLVLEGENVPPGVDDDLAGGELTLGASFNPGGKKVGLFADGRITTLVDAADDEINFYNVRLGLRIGF